MKRLDKYSFGVGDRFGCQGTAQLEAISSAKKDGISITPVWNKSSREHSIVGTIPSNVRDEAECAVEKCDWTEPYYVDADHISRENVDDFLDASDFFTLDVADHIGKPADEKKINEFVKGCGNIIGTLALPGLDGKVKITEAECRKIAEKYLAAVDRATELYEYIEKKKGKGTFVTEVSMDETDEPQSPEELLLILKALAERKVPVQTIAPKFSGSFYKGIDYVGNTESFRSEFRSDLACIQYAKDEFGLPANLKLSIHSGSDKFSLYPIIKDAIGEFDTGLHLKTAGTTWLEELAGLALSGQNGLSIAVEVYARALKRIEELCNPYASVIDIEAKELPSHQEVKKWNGQAYANALKHDQSSSAYNPHFRQLLHVAYKIAAEMGDRYLDALRENADVVGKNVTENIYRRHILPLFPAQ